MNKIECLRCGLLLPCSAVLPLLCGCGHRHRDNSELRQVDAPPGLVSKAVMVTTAYTKWLQAGAPLRTTNEVKAITAICTTCPLFQNGACGVCGCNVQRKAALATEHCPLGKPKW